MNKTTSKTILAAAIAVAASGASAEDSVNIYGEINQALVKESQSFGVPVGSRPILTDVNSRIGFKGAEDLGGGLKTFFAYEFGVDTDSVSTTPLITRHAYVGLGSSDWGKVVIGSQDGGNDSQAPLYSQAKRALGGVNGNGDVLVLVSPLRNFGSSLNTLYAPIQREQRTGNAIGYAVEYGDFDVSFRHALKGTNDASAGPNAENTTRSTELAVDWSLGALKIGVGAGRTHFAKTQNTAIVNGTPFPVESVYQATASYDFGIVKVSGLYAQNNLRDKTLDGTKSLQEYALTVSAPFGENKGLSATVSQSEKMFSFQEGDASQFQIAGYYDFSKRTRAYAGYNFVRAKGALGTNPLMIIDAPEYSKELALGLSHRF